MWVSRAARSGDRFCIRTHGSKTFPACFVVAAAPYTSADCSLSPHSM
ncbi:hypothetical protein SMICM304S_01302 [Streptomyces microflavus]